MENKPQLSNLLHKYSSDFHPLFNPVLNKDNTAFIDLSVDNDHIKTVDFDEVDQFSRYIFGTLRSDRKLYGYGGYMEDREVYRRSPLFFLQGDTARSIHLGIDVWIEESTPVYCPYDGIIHSFKNNNHYGDYGPTIIIEHQLEDTFFYSLYGHLSSDSLDILEEKMPVRKGDMIAKIGNIEENGEWPPHLHFQIISDMKDKKGDFKGVAAKYELNKYAKICPDPLPFFKELR